MSPSRCISNQLHRISFWQIFLFFGTQTSIYGSKELCRGFNASHSTVGPGLGSLFYLRIVQTIGSI
jgi:hypothetical protein